MPLPFIIIAGAAAAGLGGIGLGVNGAVKMSDAKKTSDMAQSMHKESKERFERNSKNANTLMDRLGRTEIEILNSFGEFSDLVEKINNRPTFKQCQIDDVSLPEFDAAEVRKVAVGASATLASLSSAAVGTAGGFAAAGAAVAIAASGVASTGTVIGSLSGAAATNAMLAALGGGSLAAGGGGMALGSAVLGAATLGVGLLVGGAIFGLTGGKLSEKADEAYAQAKKERETVDRIVNYLCILTDQAYQYNESLMKVNDVYQKHLGDMRKLIKYQGRTDWEEYSDGEKLMIQNTALLVGLLYKMCKQALVIPAKEKDGLNTVDAVGAGNRRREADKVLEAIRKSENLA